MFFSIELLLLFLNDDVLDWLSNKIKRSIFLSHYYNKILKKNKSS